MAGLNLVQLIGRLGRDPEIRYTNSGLAVTSLSIATSEEWKDKDSGQKQEKVEWHDCVSFGKQAEILERYLTKGSQIYVSGRLQTDKYDKDGQTHYRTKIAVNNFQFLDSKKQVNSGCQNSNNQGQWRQQPQHMGQNQAYHPDDDIPF